MKVGDFNTDMRLICREGLTEAFLLTLREPITRGAQKKPDLIEGITCAPAVTGLVLPGAATHLIKGITGELDDVKGAWHAGCVLELVVNGVLISLEGIQRRDSHPRAEIFSALGPPFLYTVPDLPGTRSNNLAVGCSFPRVRSTIPVSSRGPRRRRSWWCHTCSSTPNT